jgi:group I intron endonuclease
VRRRRVGNSWASSTIGGAPPLQGEGYRFKSVLVHHFAVVSQLVESEFCINKLVHYLIYKITNTINGKYYIGCHVTDRIDDGYMGSGKLVSKAISKYGLENFKKEIIEECSSEEEMFRRESELVVVDRNTTYNLLPGGKGGWSYVNENSLGGYHRPHTEETKRKIRSKALGRAISEKTKKLISENNKKTNRSRGKKVSAALTGKPKSAEHREKIRQALLKRRHDEGVSYGSSKADS